VWFSRGDEAKAKRRIRRAVHLVGADFCCLVLAEIADELAQNQSNFTSRDAWWAFAEKLEEAAFLPPDTTRAEQYILEHAL